MHDKIKAVIKGHTHKNYYSVCELSKFYKQITTGEGYGDLIINYKPRETDQQKAQRVQITQNRTKSIAGKIEGFFKRVFRADKLKLIVKHQDEEKSATIGQYLNNYGPDGQTVLQYAEETALFYNNIDPNAFYWVKHSIINGVDKFEPFIFESHEVKDFKIHKGGVKYAVCQLSESVNYYKKGSPQVKTINIFYYFDQGQIITALELDEEVLSYSDYYDQFKNETGLFDKTEVINKKSYIFLIQENAAPVIPISRIGYKYDKKTNAKTYVSFWDNATEEFKQLVNRGSEYDLSLTLHAFLQKIQYYTPCDFQDTETHAICRGGTMHPGGAVCPSCNGSAKKIHTSSQDVIEVQLPSDDGEMVTIAPKDLVFYVNIPFDIVKQQKDDVNEYTPKIIECVFGVDISHQQNTNATATQINNFYDTAQDQLFDFSKAPRKMFLFTVDIMAQYLNLGDELEKELLYTNIYDLESEQYLINLLKSAKEAGANSEIIENITKRLSVKQNRENSAYMNIFNIMRKFEPFATIPEALKQNVVLALPDSSVQKALYLNFKEITEDILINEPAFLILDYNQQKQIVNDRAAAYAQQSINDNSVRQLKEINNITE